MESNVEFIIGIFEIPKGQIHCMLGYKIERINLIRIILRALHHRI